MNKIPIAAPDEETIADAYVYLLGRMFVIRQEHMDRKGKGFSYNSITYNPLGSADFVNPNFEVAYLEAWIAVDENTPALLEVPQVTGRYYTAQLLDEWGEVIVNINERTFPSKPYGAFALLAPGSTAKIPEDAGRIVLHSSRAKMLSRVELKGDPEGAVKLQRALTLRSLGTPVMKPPPEIPIFNNKDLMGAEIFDDLDSRLASALDVAPNAAVMQQKARVVAAYAASGTEQRAALDKILRAKVVGEFHDYATTKFAPYRNHWVGGGGSRVGNYGNDFASRTSANFGGIWANTNDEAIYFGATRDADDKTLSGSNSYVIHFPSDQLPQTAVDAYWSVILVGVPDYRVVDNPLKRYNFNDHSPLKREPDGSLKIGIGPKAPPGVPESNWLPSPESKPFSLTFRTYVPKDSVQRGEWTPPAVTAVK